MDQLVKDALARWPDVPAVYGWLSLDARGRWHLHPQGDAARGAPGESITSPQILAFIGRNYESDAQGNWFFQNGPQRVYVRLDAAPLILRRADEFPGLQTHTGQAVTAVRQWWLDDEGRLYASTAAGPGLVEDRELAPLLAQLHVDGQALADVLETGWPEPGRPPLMVSHPAWPNAAPLHGVASGDVARRLGFVANPARPA